MFQSPFGSSFLSLINFKSNESPKDFTHQHFIEIAEKEPDYSVETRTKIIDICCSSATKIGKSHDENTIILLHGEIYIFCLDQASYLADQFAKYGDHFAKEIHGSFAILLVDKVKDSVTLITDRLNSRRVFYSQLENSYCLSSHFSYQPWNAFPLDAAGIAWYISNRNIRHNRTLFEGISIFERATIHKLTEKGVKSENYWQLTVNSKPIKKSKKHLTQELSELLIESVKRRLYDNPTVMLSLSAGYDSTAVLGVLTYDLQWQNLLCFSFEHGTPKLGSDAYQANLMSQKAGYRFELIESYTGNFIDFIVDNAQQSIGNELCSICSELNGWQSLGEKVSSLERPAFFFGDECLGLRRNYALGSIADVLTSLDVYHFEQLSLLSSLLPSDIYNKLSGALAWDLEMMTKNLPPTTNLHDVQYLLKLHERIGNWILPGRESYAGQYGNVRNPLLDNDILDFIGAIPRSLRRTKFLFRHTITRRYPELFSIPRATHPGNYHFSLTSKCIEHESLLRELIKGQKSRLDELIPPDILLKILDDVVVPSVSPPSANSQFSTPYQKLLSKVQRKFLPTPIKVRPTNAAIILTKMLILRVALAR